MQQQIQIPTPCHENWEGMKQQEAGKFCGSCSKIVVDFTSWEVNDIFSYLKQNKGTCGRFKKSQMEPVEVAEDLVVSIANSNFSTLRKIAAIIVVVFVVGTSSCTDNSKLGETQVKAINISDSIGAVGGAAVVIDSVSDVIETDGLLGEPVAVPSGPIKESPKTTGVTHNEPMIMGDIAIAPLEPQMDSSTLIKPTNPKVICPKPNPSIVADTGKTKKTNQQDEVQTMGIMIVTGAPMVK
jgi:hypothetical protein